ncbi:MAG: EamA family transporter [Pseudomonadota bacterium]
MSGEIYAVLAALSYGVAGVAITRGKARAVGDNGLFLSVLATAVLTGMIWAASGQASMGTLLRSETALPLATFAAAGLMSTVLGRNLMFRATELTGPVAASMLRRLTPVFGLPMAFVILSELPGQRALGGAVVVLLAVFVYLPPSTSRAGQINTLGLWAGIGSAAAYAAAYTLRSHALLSLPDAALGTSIGALAGVVWILGRAALQSSSHRRFQALIADRSPWHLVGALSLSAGQLLQFMALKSAPVVTVATLGTLEVFFAALVLWALSGQPPVQLARLAFALALALMGTALMLA